MSSRGSSTTRTLSIWWRIIIFLISFVIVAFFSVSLRFWSGDFTMYFIRTQNWAQLILIFMVVYIISTILTKLLQWQLRIETRPLKPKRRAR